MAKKQNPGLSEASQQIIQQIVVGLAEDFEVVTKEVTTQKIDMVATYKKNGSTIEIFYDATANLYGFQMFNHGCKTYEDINKFVQMLGIYMYINTEFMPTTQKLAQLYGQSEGINTKYQTFSGNKTDGFTAKYEIMSCDHYLFIQEKENSYLVSRVVLKKKRRFIQSKLTRVVKKCHLMNALYGQPSILIRRADLALEACPCL